MSCKNIFFLKNNINNYNFSELRCFDSNIQIEKLNKVILSEEMEDYNAYIFDLFHANGGICQMSLSSDEFKNLCVCNNNNKSIIRGAISKIFQNEKEALKIKFIIFYAILCLQVEFIGVTSIINHDDSYKFDFRNFNIEYLNLWDLSLNSLLNLSENTILIIQNV